MMMMMMMIMMARTERRISLCGWFFVFGFIAAVGAESIEMSDKEPECLEGWIPIHRGCFKFVVDSKVKWEEARDSCRSEKGDLTYIQSLKEKDLLERYLRTHYQSVATWWVGLHRQENHGTDWKWLDEGVVDSAVMPWRIPDMAKRPGNVCGVLEMFGGSMHAANEVCSRKKPYICEFNSITPRPTTKATTINPTGAVLTTPESAIKGGDDENGQETERKGQEPGGPKTTGSGDFHSSVKTAAMFSTNGSTIPPTSASTKDQKSQSPLTLSTLLSSPLTVSPSQETEEGPGPSVAPPGDVETDPSPQQPDEGRTSPTEHAVTTSQVEVVDHEEEDEDDEDESRVGKGERRTPKPDISSTGYQPARTPQPSRPSPTSPPQTRPQPPQPTMVDWDEAYEEFEGCYIPGTGGSLRDTVMAARRFYGEEATSCPELTIGRLTWPATREGQKARTKCAKGDGFATFECGEDKVCWQGQPDVTGCASRQLQNLLKRVESPDKGELQLTIAPPTIEESVELSSQLVEATDTEDTTMEDVMVTSQVITALTQKKDKTGPPQDKAQVEKVFNNVVQAGSNLISANKSAMWEEMSQKDKVRSGSTLLVAMETATVSLIEEIDEPAIIIQKDENIEVELRVVDMEEMEKEEKQELVYGSEQSDNTFSIPVETLKSVSKGRLAKAVFMTHYSMADILGGKKKKKKSMSSETGSAESDMKTMGTDSNNQDAGDTAGDSVQDNAEDEEEEEDEGPQLASYILSASLGVDGPIINLPEPISFSMKHLEEVDPKYITLCSFWNVSQDMQLGFWSQEGCRVLKTNKSHTTCECDHMTNFAILLDVHGMEMAPVHKTMLRLVTIIGCVISCVALLASWITFQCLATLQGERNSIHKNLAFTLLVAEILFVFGIDQAQHELACSIIAGFLHFLFLSAFTWMFLEGLHIIFMLVQVFDSSRSRLPYYYIVGYGAPLIIVGASCLFFYRGYGTDQYCWLTTERYFIWAFAGPVAIILLVNALFLSYAMSTVCRHADYVFSAKEKTTGSGIRAWIQGALALEVLLGLTWTLGYFLINEDSMALAYIFAILNSLQGLFIFIFHCLLNKKVQKEYRLAVRTVVKRSSSSATTQSTYTKRSSHTHPHQELHNSPSNSHQRLDTGHGHSMA